MPQKLRLIQLLGELVIPLAGYFFWNWSYFDILFFYALDLLISWAIIYVKTGKIIKERPSEDRGEPLFSVVSLLGLLSLVTLSFCLMCQLYEDFDLGASIWHFLLLEDMGLPQGVLLLPLLILTAVIPYKSQFVRFKVYELVTIEELQKGFLLGLFVSIAAIGLLFILSLFITFPEYVYVLLTALGVALYSFFFKQDDLTRLRQAKG